MKGTGLIALLALIPPVALAGQTRTDRMARSDQIFAEWDRSDSPGCAAAVVRDGQTLFERGYGSANLDYGIPLSSRSVFYIASTSKQFTAAAIALLVLRGELSLDDEVSRFIPEFPQFDHPITIRHLIHHTSGVRDYLALRGIAGRDFEDFFDMPWAVDLISRQRGLNFEAGSEYLYSNSGYLLLAEIVDRVTGTPLAQFGQEEFFGPLDMQATEWGADRHRVLPNRVVSYDTRPDGSYGRYVKNFHALGDGNLLTSVEDLIKWDRIFYDSTDAWRPLVDLMHTPGVLNSGDTLDYAFGLFHGRYRDHSTISHGGAFLGFRTELLRFPEAHFTAIVLCNFGTANPSAYAQRLADVWLFEDPPVVAEEATAPIVAPEPAVELPRAALTSLAGVYRNPESPVGDVVIAVADDGLALDAAGASFRLEALAETRFRSIEGPVTLGITFEPGPDGRVLRVRTPDNQEIVLVRTEDEPALPHDLEPFAGTYFSPELDTAYDIVVADGGLFASINGAARTMLRPAAEDAFRMTGWTLTFTRTGSVVDGFLLDAGRVRGLRFERR